MATHNDEAPDPQAILQEQAQQMAQELLRTADVPGKLGWKDFDFEIDPFDPYVDDLAGLISQGQATRETISSLLGIALDRHVPLASRLKLLKELERRAATEVRLDIRGQVSKVAEALQHLALPLSSIGLVWALYPEYLVRLVQQRNRLVGEEESSRTSEESALADALASGKGDAAALDKLGARALGLLERAVWEWGNDAPKDLALATSLIERLAKFPGRRAARALLAPLYGPARESLAPVLSKAMAAMPDAAREQVHHQIVMRDPQPAVRAALYGVSAELKDRRMTGFMVEDALGAGPWSEAGDGPAHAQAVATNLMKLGDRRAIPMLLHVMSGRPPKAEVKAAVEAAVAASPMGPEFAEGAKNLLAGKPVVVPRDMQQEEFLHKFGTFKKDMKPAAMQEEIRRVSKMWEECYHEGFGWRRPKDAIGEIGAQERDLIQRLNQEVKVAIGRLAGHPQVAALEHEYKTKWMTTPQNDARGRVPLAIILDEQQATHDPEENRMAREQEAADLYGMAVRAHQAKMTDDAKRFAAAILQIQPGHPFAQDFLGRLERNDPVPGVDASAGTSDGPRIIIP